MDKDYVTGAELDEVLDSIKMYVDELKSADTTIKTDVEQLKKASSIDVNLISDAYQGLADRVSKLEVKVAHLRMPSSAQPGSSDSRMDSLEEQVNMIKRMLSNISDITKEAK